VITSRLLPAVGVADQHDRAGDAVQEIGQERGIIGEPLRWVRRRIDGVAVGLQPLDDAVPAAGVGPGSVLKHDGVPGSSLAAARVVVLAQAVWLRGITRAAMATTSAEIMRRARRTALWL
jgi:hypothetical protein